MEKENAHRYQILWKSLVVWLTSESGWNLGGATKEDYSDGMEDQNDMKIDFWISPPYHKQEVLNDLIPKLRNKYRGSQVMKSSNQNTIMFVYDGLRIDLNLLSKEDYFDKLGVHNEEIL